MFSVFNVSSSSFFVDDVGYCCLDVVQMASLDASDIAVTHQRNFITVDGDDAVNNKPTFFNPSQDDIAYLRFLRFL